jgi:hypothetical protein
MDASIENFKETHVWAKESSKKQSGLLNWYGFYCLSK